MSRMRSNLGGAFVARAMLYALAISFPLTIAQAAKETVLYRFAGATDGSGPIGGLVRDAAGNLYGTTYEGGGQCSLSSDGCGTLFKVASDGTETTLHSFANADGARPAGGLTADAFGNLLGTTNEGGKYGLGTIFEADGQGGYLLLNSFQGGVDGSFPNGLVVDPASGDVYGTTMEGGSNCVGAGCGTVFLDSYNDVYYYQQIYAFSGSDGASPMAGLAVDASQNFYGTTEVGGAGECGTVFKLTPDGTETTLHTFSCGSDGGYPQASPLLDSKGDLYGEASRGGTGCNGDGCGTIFKLTPSGKFTVLHAFTDTEGQGPWEGLIMDARNNLYGIAERGGVSNRGTVFKLTRKGKFSVLHSFVGGSDGDTPGSRLAMDESGYLYGTTYLGGGAGCSGEGCGTVFKIKMKSRWARTPSCDVESCLH